MKFTIGFIYILVLFIITQTLWGENAYSIAVLAGFVAGVVFIPFLSWIGKKIKR